MFLEKIFWPSPSNCPPSLALHKSPPIFNPSSMIFEVECYTTKRRTYGQDAHTYCLFYCIRFIKCSSKLKVFDPNPADILVLMWLPPYQDQGKVAPYVTDIATDCHTSSRCHVTTVTILLQDLHHFIALLITSEPNNRITNHGFIWFLLGVSCLHVLRQLLLP